MSSVSSTFTLTISSSNLPHGPHVAPPQAAAVGFTHETFFDGPWSLSTIDVNNTKESDLKWYVDMTWPRSTLYTNYPEDAWRAFGINSPGDFSISNNNLVFAPQAPVTASADSMHPGYIMTCTAIDDPPYYRGTTFSGGAYFEVQATWPNGTEHGGEPSWPNAWTMPIKFLTGTGVVPYDFSEIDIFEAPFGRNFHQWSFAGETMMDHASNCGACTTISGMRFGILLVPASLNRGTPKMEYYANDVFVANATPPEPYGTSIFETAANEPAALILGTAHSNPTTFQSVRVWQRPPS